MKKNSLALLSIVFLGGYSHQAHSNDIIEWHTSNVQVLKGWDYKLGPKNRAIMTFEHANRWTYGDFFMFVDATRYDEGGTNIYGEFSPRLSLSKISNSDLSFGPIKDVLISTTLEKGKKDLRAYLYGGAVDLDIKGFSFLTINAYLRDNPNISGTTWQSTIAWKRPVDIGRTSWVFEGFSDIAGAEGDSYKSNQSFVPRFLLDVGKSIGGESGRLYAGVEWQYWHNKAGVSGVTESAPQLQLKWVFD